MDGVIVLSQQDAVKLVNRLTMCWLVLSFCGALGALFVWDLMGDLARRFLARRVRKGGGDVRP